jgi:hypothetical protein
MVNHPNRSKRQAAQSTAQEWGEAMAEGARRYNYEASIRAFVAGVSWANEQRAAKLAQSDGAAS